MIDTPLSESVAALSKFFVGDRTFEETLHRVAELTTHAVEPADFIGLTMLVDGRKRTAVFTDPASPQIDQAQYDTGDGPCLHAFETGKTVIVGSTRGDGPYPAFRAAALAHGINSALALPMIAGDVTVGAMNIYSRNEGAFTDRDRETAQQFADHAAVVLANAQAYWDAHNLSLRLHESMDYRSIIEQAKGILMATQTCSADEAFDLLTAASQRENVKLRVIAQRIVDRATADRSVEVDG